MRCPNCEAPIDVLDMCQECIEANVKLLPDSTLAGFCKAGHEYTPETEGWTNRGAKTERRYCLICRRQRDLARKTADRDRKREARHKAKAAG